MNRLKMFEDFDDEDINILKNHKVEDKDGKEYPTKIEISSEDIEITILQGSFDLGHILVDIPEDEKTYFVNSVHVSKKHRRKGLYVSLIKKMLEIIGEKGVDTLISPKNPPGGKPRTELADEFWNALYKAQDKHGLKIDKKGKDYYVKTND